MSITWERLTASIVAVLTLCGCEGSNPGATLQAYLDASFGGSPGTAYDYLSEADRAAIPLGEYRRTEGSDSVLQGFFAQYVTYEIREVVEVGDSAEAVVSLTTPDLSGVMADFLGMAMLSAFGGAADSLEGELAAAVREKYADSAPPTITTDVPFTLRQGEAGWRVYLNLAAEKLVARGESLEEQGQLDQALAAFEEAIALAPRNVVDVTAARDSVLRLLEIQRSKADYIASSIELIRPRVIRQSRYSFGDPEPTFFGTVRNDGDRTVVRLVVTVYFLGDDGNPIAEKAYSPVSDYSFSDSSPLRPGYVRDFGYYISDDAPQAWAGEIRVEVTDITFEEEVPTGR